MDQQVKTLLELMRIEGIARMLQEQIEPQHLQNIIKRVTHAKPYDSAQKLETLNRNQLIQITEQLPEIITYDIVNQYYEQYRYGLKPGFTICLLIGSAITKDIKNIFDEVQLSLTQVIDDPGASLRCIRAKRYATLADDVVEFSLSYLKKHNYIDENETPQYIYEYEEFFIWLNTKAKFLAIKNVPEKVFGVVTKQFGLILDQKVTYIKLTKPIIEKAFGSEQLKGTYLKSNAADNEAEKIIISDTRLKEKESVLNGVSSYDMTSTFLVQKMSDDTTNTLGINCDKGKIYLTRNVTATSFRDWSISAIQKIIPQLVESASLDDYQAFRARNVIQRDEWNCTDKQAQVFEQIVYGVYKSISSGHQTAYINIDTKEIWKTTNSSWILKLISDCPECGDKSFIYCPNCHSHNLRLNASGRLFCSECGEVLEKCLCDSGHLISIADPYPMVHLLPNAQVQQIIQNILHDMFCLQLQGTFEIINNRIQLIPLYNKAQAYVKDIPELKRIDDIHLEEEEYLNLIDRLEKMKEKCRTATIENCNTCTLTDKRICLLKIFTTYSGYRPSPHNGHEFADISFDITLNGTKKTLVGVMKSSIGKNKNLTKSSAEAREMLQQVLMMTKDERVGLIAAICPSRFQGQFEANLIHVSRLTQKPIVILDDLYMCKQLKAFENGILIP